MFQLPKGKIALTPIYDPDVTKGGIIVPDQAKERCDQGIVKYISPDEEFFKIGDYVLFSAYDGTLIQLEDEGMLIVMKSEALVAIINPPWYVNTVINGLYFKTKDGEFIEANYEMAVEIMSQALTENGFPNRIRFKDRKSTGPASNEITKYGR